MSIQSSKSRPSFKRNLTIMRILIWFIKFFFSDPVRYLMCKFLNQPWQSQYFHSIEKKHSNLSLGLQMLWDICCINSSNHGNLNIFTQLKEHSNLSLGLKYWYVTNYFSEVKLKQINFKYDNKSLQIQNCHWKEKTMKIY